MTHPAERFSYPTFMDAVLAGAERPTMDRMDDWVGRWHDGQMDQFADLHDALGLTWEQYQEIIVPFGEEKLKEEVARRRRAIDWPSEGPVTFRFGVPASSQIESFQNATLTTLDSGHAISVSMTPPSDLDVSDNDVVRTTMMSVFRRFVDAGWKLEVQIGPDDADAQLD